MRGQKVNLSTTLKSPLDYFVSGAITSGVITGGFNYGKVKEGTMSKNDALKNTLKVASQGGIASGSAIASVNYLANRNYLGAALSMAFGIGSVVAIEKISSGILEADENITTNTTKEEK